MRMPSPCWHNHKTKCTHLNPHFTLPLNKLCNFQVKRFEPQQRIKDFQLPKGALEVQSSERFVKKLPLEYQKVTKTYLPSYLCDSSDGSDISDTSDSCDSSDSSDQKSFFLNCFFFLPKNLFSTKTNFTKITFTAKNLKKKNKKNIFFYKKFFFYLKKNYQKNFTKKVFLQKTFFN